MVTVTERKARSRSHSANVVLATAFFSLTLLLLLMATLHTLEELQLVLACFAGASAMAAMSLLLRDEAPLRGPSRVNVTFNTAVVARSIEQGMDLLGPARLSQPPSYESVPEELSPRRFVGRDNALALAYLRLELERTLALLIDQYAIVLSSKARTMSARDIVRVLMQRELVPEGIGQSILEVLSVCNQAMHGGKVSDETAVAVVSAGEELLRYLHALRAKRPKDDESFGDSTSPQWRESPGAP